MVQMIRHSHHHETLLPATEASAIPLIEDENNNKWLILPKNTITILVLIKGRVKTTLIEFPKHCLRLIICGPTIERWCFMDELHVPIDLKHIEDHRAEMRHLNIHRTFGVQYRLAYWFKGRDSKDHIIYHD